jgi:hypothetical protein
LEEYHDGELLESVKGIKEKLAGNIGKVIVQEPVKIE